MFEFGDEHRRYAMQRRTAFGGDGFQRLDRIESVVRENRRRTMADTGEIAHHHAEAVIERNGNAEPVLLAEAHAFADDAAIVENIEVTERGALRHAGRAAGELDVDRIVRRQRLSDVEQLCRAILAFRADI